ncbi:unnamed protein product, partial [Cyprideis torosa]
MAEDFPAFKIYQHWKPEKIRNDLIIKSVDRLPPELFSVAEKDGGPIDDLSVKESSSVPPSPPSIPVQPMRPLLRASQYGYLDGILTGPASEGTHFSSLRTPKKVSIGSEESGPSSAPPSPMVEGPSHSPFPSNGGIYFVRPPPASPRVTPSPTPMSPHHRLPIAVNPPVIRSSPQLFDHGRPPVIEETNEFRSHYLPLPFPPPVQYSSTVSDNGFVRTLRFRPHDKTFITSKKLYATGQEFHGA